MGKDVEECVDHEKMNGSFVGGEESNKLKHERYIQYSPNSTVVRTVHLRICYLLLYKV